MLSCVVWIGAGQVHPTKACPGKRALRLRRAVGNRVSLRNSITSRQPRKYGQWCLRCHLLARSRSLFGPARLALLGVGAFFVSVFRTLANGLQIAFDRMNSITRNKLHEMYGKGVQNGPPPRVRGTMCKWCTCASTCSANSVTRVCGHNS